MILKRFFSVCLLWCVAFSAWATQQAPDVLLYKKQKYQLQTGWGHPSPLETFYSQNRIKYPFSMIATNNYRGHIATWTIEKQQLFLAAVNVGKEQHLPSHFGVKSSVKPKKPQTQVWADWFSGVIVGDLIEKSKTNKAPTKQVYFQIRHGKVVDVQAIDASEVDHDSHNHDAHDDEKKSKLKVDEAHVKAVKAITAMHQRYMGYYLRLGINDTISFKDGSGLLQGNAGISPVLSFYNNDHIQWPFNWENTEKSGAPGGQWQVDNNRLYLTRVNLNYGLSVYKAARQPLQLTELFKDKVVKKRVFADWVSGVFIAELAAKDTVENIADRMTEFKPTSRKIFQVNQGRIEQIHDLPKGFNPLAPSTKLSPKLLKLFNSWEKQMF